MDGHRGRWVVVTTGAGSRADVALVDSLDTVVEQVRHGEVGAMAIDMPIGLPDAGPRACDVEARALLGERRSTVFPAPVRATLQATDYADACARSRAATGKALSIQAFNLIGPIRQLDALLRPSDAGSIVEAHPELAFARLAGEPLPSKHRAGGRRARTATLQAALGPTLDVLQHEARRHKVPTVDLFDAAVLTITARHVAAGTELRLGGDVDPTGKPAQVVY